MRKIFNVLIFVLVYMFLGCTEEGLECFQKIRIDFKSTSKIDSVQFYLNNERICYESMPVNSGICEECENIKGISFNYIKCQVSKDKEIFDYSSSLDSCFISENFPAWNIFECRIDERQYGKTLDSTKLTLYIYSENGKSNEMNISLYGGNYYNVVSEQDTAKWFSYDEIVMNYNYDYFKFSALWRKIGCINENCAFYLQSDDADCYDR